MEQEEQGGAPDIQTIGDHRVNYHIKTEQFEGPLDLLLTLIEKRKLHISDFSLASVADDYIAKIRSFETFPTGDVANFLLVASTLVLIKSKAILPELDLSGEEEENIDDLKRRLALLELFRKLSGDIRARYGKEIIFERSERPEVIPVFAPEARLTIPELASRIGAVLSALPKKVVLPKAVIRKVISLEEMMDRLATRVTRALKTSFKHFASYEKNAPVHQEKKIEIIVSFLAMLELVKQGVVHVSQSERHGDIDIETHSFDTPQYGANPLPN